MTLFSKRGVDVFAPTNVDGSTRQPILADAQVWTTEAESLLNAIGTNGGLIFDTKADLDADLAHAANTLAWVVADSATANNGIYQKSGASGSGSWTRKFDLPYSFVKATDVGGTANAIAVTTTVPVNESQIILLPVATTNTGSPTVSFNGGSALTVKTLSGNDVATGGLVSGSVLVGVISGSNFRLLSDQASAAIQAAAEAAQAAAEAARDAAEAAMTTVIDPQFATKATAEAYSPDIAPDYIRTAGETSAGDGGGALYKNNGTTTGELVVTLSDGTTLVGYDLADEYESTPDLDFPTSLKASKVAFTQGVTGSVSRSFLDKGRDILDIRDFLASDGSDLNNPAVELREKFNAATRVLRDRGGGTLRLPNATLHVSGVWLFNDVVIEGDSKAGSILKKPAGSNADIVLGRDMDEVASAYTYFGTTPGDPLTKGANRCGVRRLTLDGNAANATVAGLFAVWGHGLTIEDAILKDSSAYGLRTEWTDGAAVPIGGTFRDVTIDTCQKHGWWFNGPHDSYVDNVIIVDASQEADDTYDALFNEKGNGRFLNLHTWHRSGITNRVRWGLNCGGFANEYMLCHFEGGRGQVMAAAQNNKFLGCRIYAPFANTNGSPMAVVSQEANIFLGCHFDANTASGNRNVYGLQIGDPAPWCRRV